MYFGLGIFAIVAVLCIVAGAAAMKRSRDYGNRDGDDHSHDVDFDEYEGFDK